MTRQLHGNMRVNLTLSREAHAAVCSAPIRPSQLPIRATERPRQQQHTPDVEYSYVCSASARSALRTTAIQSCFPIIPATHGCTSTHVHESPPPSRTPSTQPWLPTATLTRPHTASTSLRSELSTARMAAPSRRSSGSISVRRFQDARTHAIAH